MAHDDKHKEQIRRRIERAAFLLDERYEIPGTGIRFGWDAIIGLVPGIGDALTLCLSAYIIIEATHLGVPREVLVRMLANSVLDSAVGTIPVVGDVADVAFKANKRNSKLLLSYLERPEQTRRHSKLFLAGVVAAVLFVLVAVVYLVYRLIAGLIHAL